MSHRLMVLAVFGALLLVAPPARAEEGPTVVRTVPALGASDVDPGLEKVEIWFSEAMDPSSMSLVRLWGRSRLGYREDAKPRFDGPLHLVIPVRLEPGTSYGVAINGGGKTGFKSAGGVPALSFDLLFRTAEKVKDDGPVGRWRLVEVGGQAVADDLDHKLGIHLFHGGTWGCVIVKEGTVKLVAGNWRVDPEGAAEGPQLALSGDGVRSMLEFIPDAALRDYMSMDLGDEKKIAPDYFWAASKSAPVWWDDAALRVGPEDFALRFESVSAPAARALEGTWTAQSGDPQVRTWKLGANGKVEGVLEGKPFQGTWRADDAVLEMTSEAGSGERVRGNWILAEADHKYMSYDLLVVQVPKLGQMVLLKRTSAGGGDASDRDAPAAKTLIGRWTVLTEEGEALIEFKSDGTYSRTFGAPGSRVTVTGTWKIVGANLHVHDGEEDEDLVVPFVIEGKNVLKLTIDGQEVPFTREGTAPAPTPPTPAPPATLPAELCGKWAAENRQTGETLILLLTGTGHAELYIRTREGEQHSSGTWKHTPGKLILHNTKTNDTTEVGYRLANATTMALDFGRFQVQVVRVSGDPTKR